MSVESNALTEVNKDHPELSRKPRGAMRWKYWSLFGLLIIVFDNSIPRAEPLNYVYLTLFLAISLAAAIHQCREMWTLKAKRSPQWVGYVAAFGSAAVILTLLVLHDLNMFRWNHHYFEWPFALFCAATAIGAWLTEWRKSVRVYAVLNGLVFVSTKVPSNRSMQSTGRERPATD